MKVQTVQAKLRAIETGTNKFTALLSAERERLQASLSQLQAKVSTFTADTARYTAQMGGESQRNEIAVRAAEATARNNVAYFEVLARQFDSHMQAGISGNGSASIGVSNSYSVSASLDAQDPDSTTS